MKKPSIPAITVKDPQISALLRPIKENLEILNGTRTGLLTELPANASLADVISKVNGIIARLNA